MQHAKAHLQDLPRPAMTQYTMLLMAPTVVTMLTGTGGRLRPMFNVTISNVPGPDKPLFFRGAELLAIYPASIATHGQALNITCQSYAGTMNFGFTGCHSSVPSLQKLAVHAAEALQELEAAVLAPKPARRRRAPAAAAESAAEGAAENTRTGPTEGITPRTTAPRKAASRKTTAGKVSSRKTTARSRP